MPVSGTEPVSTADLKMVVETLTGGGGLNSR